MQFQGESLKVDSLANGDKKGPMIDTRDVIEFFDRLAPAWDGDVVRNEAVIARILDLAAVVPGTEVLEKLSRQEYRRPEIVSYVGYYRDAAIFALSNGLFARVDLRPELRQVDVIPYFEACYREGNNPLQAPLPAAEIARLRRIYEETDW